MLHYVTEPNYSDVCPVFLMLHFPPQKKKVNLFSVTQHYFIILFNKCTGEKNNVDGKEGLLSRGRSKCSLNTIQ